MPNTRYSEFTDKDNAEKEKGVKSMKKDRMGTNDGREGGEPIVKSRRYLAKYGNPVVDPNLGNKNLPKHEGAEGGV